MPHRAARAAALVLVFGIGVLAAGQARINGELGRRLGDALVAALLSFLVGCVPLAVAVLARRPARRALVNLPRSGLPWWAYLGGVGGATLVFGSAAAAPVLGVAVLTVAQVAGQTTGSLAVDRVGLAPGPARPLSVPRLAGAGLALVAVAVGTADRPVGRLSLGLLALAVFAGLAVSVQLACNGQVGQRAGEPLVAALLNFAVGTLALLAAAAALAATAGRGLLAHGLPTVWWLYLGGPLGAVFVTVAVYAVRELGVLRLSLAVIAGQLAGGLAIDRWAPGPHPPIGPATLAGAVLTVLAVAIAGRTDRPVTR